MGPKKVADLLIAGKYYYGELNDVNLRGGDISGSDGIFNGVLNASSISSVKNPTISFNAVASSFYFAQARAPVSTTAYFPENVTYTAFTFNFSLASQEVGTARIGIDGIFDKNGGFSQNNFTFFWTIKFNGVSRFVSNNINVASSPNKPFQINAAYPSIAGINSIVVTVHTNNGHKTPYGYMRDIRCVVDNVRQG